MSCRSTFVAGAKAVKQSSDIYHQQSHGLQVLLDTLFQKGSSSSARQKDTCKVQAAWASGILKDLMLQKCPAANGLQLLRLEHLDLTIIAAHRKAT